MTTMNYSPAYWFYECNLHFFRNRRGAVTEISAFEISNSEAHILLRTNEEDPLELQLTNAMLAATAPRLLQSLVTCANLLADYDESDGAEGEAYRDAMAAIVEATGRAV
jgi:hypothetical protein